MSALFMAIILIGLCMNSSALTRTDDVPTEVGNKNKQYEQHEQTSHVSMFGS